MHAPYQAPSDWSGDVLRGMLASTDAALGNMVGTLKAKGMYANSVLFYSADNGGTDRGSNWPLRGSKHCECALSRSCASSSSSERPTRASFPAHHPLTHVRTPD